MPEQSRQNSAPEIYLFWVIQFTYLIFLVNWMSTTREIENIFANFCSINVIIGLSGSALAGQNFDKFFSVFVTQAVVQVILMFGLFARLNRTEFGRSDQSATMIVTSITVGVFIIMAMIAKKKSAANQDNKS